MRIVTFALIVLVVVPVWASEPGQPLDCSDWLLLESGIACTATIPMDCQDSPPCLMGDNQIVDNNGRMISIRRTLLPVACGTGGANAPLYRTELVAFDGEGETVIASIEDRCIHGLADPVIDNITARRAIDVCNVSGCTQLIPGFLLSFDAVNGRILVPFHSWCDSAPNSTCSSLPEYSGWWLASFSGFTTTFEVLQTYAPASGPISFRVPYMPEGFQYADYFDTYWGDLATVGNWSQAQPLQCGYPATAPTVGDYLTVEDTLPTPTPGGGYYYVTAVNYQGQRRYGRQSNGGVLSGRDPAVLPLCE